FTGSTSDEDQAFMQHAGTGEDSRKAKVARGGDLIRDLAERCPDPVFLIKKVGTVARDAGNFIAEIDVSGLLEDLDLRLRADLIQHFFQLVIIQDVVFDALQVPVQSDNRNLSG